MFGRSLYSPQRNRSHKRLNTNLDPLQDLQQSIARLSELLILIQRENDIIGGTGEDHRQGERNGEHLNVTEKSPTFVRRKKPSYANMLRSDEMVHSYYLSMSVVQEDEMIELIRNIMDLVVKGEQRAAKMNDFNSNHGSDKDDTEQQSSEESQHSAIFEYFCETNTLSVITNIATGLAFITFSKTETKTTTNNNSGGGKAPTKIHLYPPISVAIQIIQSISILLTNLSKATSLYFILSNNKINDLIHFPFDNYKMAEYNKTQDKKNSTNKKVDISSIGELSEMEAAYIMFLKSLCMRMNSETLQFYLQLEGGETLNFPLYKRALSYCDPSHDEFIRVTAMNICLNTLQLITKGNSDGNDTSSVGKSHLDNISRPDQVKAPEASLHQSKPLPFRERLAIASYVCCPSRVESLTRGIFHRLAYLCSSLDDVLRTIDQIDSMIRGQLLSTENVNYSKNKSKEARVDKTLLEIDEESKLEDKKKRMDGFQLRRTRAVKTFHDIVTDFQYEFMFLEDILKVGLVPLNEQIMENMFAAVIYPLILTPMQLFSQHSQRSFANTATDSYTSKGNPLLMQMKHLDRTLTTNGGNTQNDSSLAKAALFVIAIIFHHVTHEQLLSLLTTALMHPKTPIASDELVFNAVPDVTFEDTDGRTYITTDELQSQTGVNFYRFGTPTSTFVNEKEQGKDSFCSTKERYNFIFLPALLYIKNWSETRILPSSLENSLRENPFRRMILCCLAGTDGMVELQSIAVHVIDSMVSTLKSSVVKNVILTDIGDTDIGSVEQSLSSHSTVSEDHLPQISESMSDLDVSSPSNHVVEFITSLCVSVVTSFKSYRDCWSIQYNHASAHAIYSIYLMEDTIRKYTIKLLEKRRQQSLSFLLQIPSRLEKKMSESEKVSMDENLIMDRMFFEPFCDGGTFVVESIFRDPSLGNNDVLDGSGYILVTKDERLEDISNSICKDLSSKSFDDYDSEEATYKCGANSVIAYLKMDSFVSSLQDRMGMEPVVNASSSTGRSVSTFAEKFKQCREHIKHGSCFLLSPLSTKFQKLMFHEESFDSINTEFKAGSIVSLVGKAAYPCVCEVKEENDSLFRDGGSYVISDGIKWQSVYLVISGSYMMLTESVEGDSGGNGRVVISTLLSHLVSVYDESLKGNTNNNSPARRIFLTHFSTQSRPPGLFSLIDDGISRNVHHNKDIDHPTNHIQMTKSILDLWFEDENAARKAHKSLSSKIFKDRFKRGQRIKDTLLEG